jgi:phage host-nuclease inhibitor protein Gam
MSAEPVHIPNITPFEALTIDVEDLLLEARNWCDGDAATTQAQVDEIARLKDELNDRAKLLEAERVTEKKPLDDQIAAIQDRFNVWIAPLKNKKPGKIPMALDALDAAKRPFLLAREAEIRAAADKARAEAEAKAREAAEAARAAAASDLQAREDAEAMFAEAEAAARAAKAAEAEKAHAHGLGRAQGLRTRVVAEITDPAAAIRYYYGSEPEAFTALVQQLADRDARANRKLATGVTFRDERY